MSQFSEVVVGGPVIFDPDILGQVLGRSCFYMTYKENRSLEFFHNDNSGGKTIFVIQNISHESARKLAAGVGLKPSYGEDDANCRSWGKHDLIIDLYHDGSEDAEKMRVEAFKLNIECKVHRVVAGPWHVHHSMYRYGPSPDYTYWSVDKVIEEMKKWSANYFRKREESSAA